MSPPNVRHSVTELVNQTMAALADSTSAVAGSSRLARRA